MDESYDPDIDRAARRREQNRIAQRNHRKRKQLAKQSTLQPSSQQLSGQDPQLPWSADWRTDQDDNDTLTFSLDREQWDEDGSNNDNPQQDSEIDDTAMGGLNPELFSVFDGMVNPDHPLNSWQPDSIYPSPSTDDEQSRNATAATNKVVSMQSLLTNNTPTDSDRDSNARRKRQTQVRTSSALSQSSNTPLQSSTLDPRPRAQSSVDLSSRTRAIARQQKQVSPPTFTDRDSMKQSSLREHGRTSSLTKPQHQRQGEKNLSPDQVARSGTYGQTALHLAARQGSHSLVRYLLDRGLKPDARDGDGLTALHHAISTGHEDTVSELLAGGADIEVTDDHGRTALHFAVEQKQNGIVVLLIHKGADLQATVGRPKATRTCR